MEKKGGETGEGTEQLMLFPGTYSRQHTATPALQHTATHLRVPSCSQNTFSSFLRECVVLCGDVCGGGEGGEGGSESVRTEYLNKCTYI